MNKLIINGDAWGEFTGSTKKKDGNIEIRGYRSYDTLHTVRVMDHPEGLNINQQIILDWMKNVDNAPFATIAMLDDDFVGIETPFPIPSNVVKAFEELDDKQQFGVLAAFAAWGQSEVAE